MSNPNNDKLIKSTKFLIELLLIAVSAAAVFFTLKERVSSNSERIIQIDQKTEAVNEKASVNREELIELRTDVKYIKSGIDDIKKEIKNSQ